MAAAKQAESGRSIHAALLNSILDEWSSRLGINTLSRIAAWDAGIAETLVQWMQERHLDMPQSISVLEEGGNVGPELQKKANIIPVPRFRDDEFTHVLAHVTTVRAADLLPVLKKTYFALIPKGIAVVTCAKADPLRNVLAAVSADTAQTSAQPSNETISHDDFVELAEDAQFERGKVRWSEREVLIRGAELKQLKEDLKTRLGTNLNPCEEGQGWKAAFEKAFDHETKPRDGLVVEAWLMIAMRWDLLNA